MKTLRKRLVGSAAAVTLAGAVLLAEATPAMAGSVGVLGSSWSTCANALTIKAASMANYYNVTGTIGCRWSSLHNAYHGSVLYKVR